MGLPLRGEHSRLLDERHVSTHGATWIEPCFDTSVLELLFVPPLPHEALPARPEDHNVHRIRAGGVVTRYVEDIDSVRITVEGDRPAATVMTLVEDLGAKLARLEETPYVAALRRPSGQASLGVGTRSGRDAVDQGEHEGEDEEPREAGE